MQGKIDLLLDLKLDLFRTAAVTEVEEFKDENSSEKNGK